MAVRSRRKAKRPRRARRVSGNGAGEATREHLIGTAERLFAELGVVVSTRQIGEAAGQANKSVIAYHFGTKADLVLAIAHRHAPDIEARRAAMLEALGDSNDLAAWLTCLVKPITDHLGSLDAPTWYARFLAHCMSDPALRQLVFDDAIASPSMRTALEGVTARLPVLPGDVFEARGQMTQHVIVHTCADRERALQAGSRHPSWEATCDAIVDALVGLWRAPNKLARRASKP